jgi:hypothetical protein
VPADVRLGDGSSSGPYQVSGSHAYAGEGSYPVTVTDTTDGDTASNQGTAHAGDAPLSASGPPSPMAHPALLARP